MRTKIGLYFQLERNDPKDTFHLMQLVLNRLEQLETEGVNVEYLELRLREAPVLQTSKQAYIKLDGNGRTFIDSENSSCWDDAFTTTFDRIQNQFRSLNTRARHASLKEIPAYNAASIAH